MEEVFKQSVDLVLAAEARYTNYGADDTAAWYASQDEIWDHAMIVAKAVCMPTFVNKSPVEVMAQVDEMAVAWQAHVQSLSHSQRLANEMELLIR